MNVLAAVILCFALPCVASQDAATSLAERAPVLAIRVGQFKIEGATMQDVLRMLRSTDATHILIGFESVAHRPGETGKHISISVQNETVGEVMAELCRQDPRYTFETIEGVLLHVFPKDHRSDPAKLLDIKIKSFSLDARIVPASIVDLVPSDVPELWSYMMKKNAENARRKGLPPPATGGSIGSGNMDPTIHIHLENVTVRQLLDEVVLYSRKLNADTPPDAGGNKIPPTSWFYDFTIDPDSYTGLGGVPLWKSF
jgi:hypothetical protein